MEDFADFPKKYRRFFPRPKIFSDDVLIYTPTEGTRNIPSADKFFETAKKKLPSYSDESLYRYAYHSNQTPPTQAAVDRQTYSLVSQVDRNSYRSQTKSLCDLIDLDVPVCAAPSDVDQTDIRTATSFLPGRMGTTSDGSSSFG